MPIQGHAYSTWIRCVVLVIVAAILAACTPTHTVRPLPDFVQTGIQAGDKVILTTLDGEETEFVVVEVTDDALVSATDRYLLSDIAELKKLSWSEPSSPCGDGKPLGCSVPLWVSLTSEAHEHYRGAFHEACVQHDYCYRHGFNTYGHDRAACDEEFKANMEQTCPKPESKLGKAVDVLFGGVQSRDTCLSVADDFYSVVRRFGADKFQADDGSYCEYDGPR